MESTRRFLYELREKAIAEQERRLAAQRESARAAMLAASVALPFLASRPLGPLAAIALCFFLPCLAGCVWILMPHDFAFAFLGDELLVGRASDECAALDAAYIAAGTWLRRRLQINNAKLTSLAAMLTMSCTMLGCEIATLALDLVR
jgi:hypothetical protein